MGESEKGMEGMIGRSVTILILGCISRLLR